MNNKEIEQSAIERFGIPRKLEDISEEELRHAVAECKTFAGVRLRLGLGSEGCTNDDVKKRCAEAGIDCGRLESKKASRWEMYTRDELFYIVDKCDTVSEICRKLGHGENITGLRKALDNIGIELPRNKSHKHVHIAISHDEIDAIVQEAHTFTEVARHLHISIQAAHKLLDKHGIDYSHFDPKFYALRFDKLAENTDVSTDALRSVLKHYGRTRCEICDNDGTWYEAPITLQVHHKNGVHSDNRLENLMLVCPTCHAQIEGRGMKDTKFPDIKKGRSEKGRRCERCKIEMWENDIVPLDAHHKDGNNLNNNPDNIEILCPNCHSQTNNFTSKGKKLSAVSDEQFVESLDNSKTVKEAIIKIGLSVVSGNYQRARYLIQKYNIIHLQGIQKYNIQQIVKELIEQGAEWVHNQRGISYILIKRIIEGNHKFSPSNITYPLSVFDWHENMSSREQNSSKKDLCPRCGHPKNKKSKLCLKCHAPNKGIAKPERNKFKEEIRANTFTDVARKYGVSPSAIRQWCRHYNLPDQRSIIKMISDKDWKDENFVLSNAVTYTPEDIVFAYQRYRDISKVCEIWHCDRKTVKSICRQFGIDTTFNRKAKHAKPLIAINVDTGKEEVFASQYDAAEWLYLLALTKSKRASTLRIMDVVKGNRKTAYGYYWQAADIEEE